MSIRMHPHQWLFSTCKRPCAVVQHSKQLALLRLSPHRDLRAHVKPSFPKLSLTVATLTFEPLGSIFCGGNTWDRSANSGLLLPPVIGTSGAIISAATVFISCPSITIRTRQCPHRCKIYNPYSTSTSSLTAFASSSATAFVSSSSAACLLAETRELRSSIAFRGPML
jgi:hypothetical protein